ncbi:MAG: long-chain fatty acid--CoA ligase [Acidimicrobiia bacterium]|nr:long-chain fatty acid--CoA ligase [Acidimicrobiia bacterium]
MTLASLLFSSEFADDCGVVVAGSVVTTRAELEIHADEIADELREVGVVAGNAVAVSMANGSSLVAALFGVWRAGAVYVPMNPLLTHTECERLLDAAQPAAILFGATEPQHDPRQRWTVTMRPGARVYSSDVALVQFTSGTTGSPKPVQLGHDSVLSLIDGVLASLRPNPETKRRRMHNLVPVSLSLWAGIYQILFSFRVGSPVVLMERFEPVEFARLIAKYEIRSVVLPPAAMVLLVEEQTVASLEPLKYVRSITAPLSPFQAKRFMVKFGIAVLNSYGQTELGGEVVGWTAADAREFTEKKLGAVGKPHRGVEVAVIGNDAKLLPVDEIGELVVRTDATASTAAHVELRERTTADGWFRTGDIAKIDSEGFVWIEGRMSTSINRGGFKFTPEEIEEVLRAEGSVVDVAVVGRPDARLGEVPWAFVVMRNGEILNVNNLEYACREHLAPYKVPVEFRQVEQLPRNEVGKVLKSELSKEEL